MSPAATASIAASPRCRRWLALLLVVSFGLRVWLACLGGQRYWPDENRYELSKLAAHSLRQGHWRPAADALFGQSIHTLFPDFGLIPALAEEWAGPHPAAVAGYFGLFSVGAIFLIWAVARRSGAGETEALWAAYLAACANSLFYYSRNYFPYDISLCAMLGGIWWGLGAWSPRNSLRVGVIAGIGFFTYNGYWLLGGCVLILHSLLGGGGWRRFVPRAAWAGAGLALVVLCVAGLNRALGFNLVGEDSQLGTIAQGDFPFGRRVIAGYLWYAEGGVLLVWLAASAYALVGAWRDRRLGRVAWSAGGIVLVLGGLVFLSDIIPEFAVQGRRVRCVAPFLCLLAATGIYRFLQSRARPAHWARAIALLVLALAAWNFSRPFRQVFPDEFYRLAARAIAQRSGPGYQVYGLAFVQNLWGQRFDLTVPAGEDLVRRSNPLQFRAYQYEGWDTGRRAELSRYDIAMRLVASPARLTPPARWLGYPGPVRLTLRFPRNATGTAEPLVTTGRTGQGDLFFVRYLDSTHVEFGLDHWGAGASESGPIVVDYGQPHQLILLAGALLPPEAGGFYQRSPGLSPLRDTWSALLDGRLVFSTKRPFYPARPEEILFGIALIGGSTTQPGFSGEVLRLESAPDSAVAAALPMLAADRSAAELARMRPADWRGALGPVRLRFTLPPSGGAPVQPLLSVGTWGQGEFLYLVREDPDHVRVGWRQSGSEAVLSERVSITPDAVQEMELSLGSLLPPAGALRYATDGNFAALRHLLYVRLNRQVLLKAPGRFLPALSPAIFGANLVDETSRVSFFQGVLRSIFPLDPAAIPAILRLAEMVPADAAAWDGYPGPIRLKVIFPSGRGGQSEPLLETGVTGSGDILYVHYDDDRHVRFGFDHWRVGGPVSAAIPLEPGAEQDLVISLGSLLPPSQSRLFREHPGWAKLRRVLFLSLNGKEIFGVPAECYPSDLDQMTVGVNSLGGSTAGPLFSGDIRGVARMPVAKVLEAISTFAPP